MLEMLIPAALVDPSDAAAQNLDWLGPVVTAVGFVFVAIISGASGMWKSGQDRKSSKEDKAADLAGEHAPKVIDGWEEVRRARAEASSYYNLYRIFEEMYYTSMTALRKLSRRVREAHPEEEFDQSVIDALEAEPPETDGK
jgi:hypothetical protein